MHDWISLENKNSSIYDKIKSNWQNLLDANNKELIYHKYISNYAGFFFSDFYNYITISKLKLGSEYEVDFVNIKDQRSNGIQYEFIEIEKPSSPLFTKSGIPSNDLNCALQQVRDWKRFLIDDKAFFKKFLPGNNTRVITDSIVKFTIIIGRRTNNDFIIDKRNQIAAESNIEIRSFDYLTDKLRKRQFFNYPCLDSKWGDFIENQLENPFAMAISDSEWKKFCRKRICTTHFYSSNLIEIIEMRKNNKLFKEFQNSFKGNGSNP